MRTGPFGSRSVYVFVRGSPVQIFGPARANNQKSGRTIVFVSVAGYLTHNPQDRVAYLRFEQPDNQKQIGLTLSSAEWQSVRSQVDRIFVDEPEARV